MKNIFFAKLFLAAMVFLAPTGASAQVTIGSNIPPEATLDIIGDTANVHGQAFRLIDGNQAPGRVLTCGGNGIGTWQNPVTATTIRGTIQQAQNIPFEINQSDFNLQAANVWQSQKIFMAPNSYIDLPPGLWRVDAAFPVRFPSISALGEWIEFLVVFTTDPTATIHNISTVANYPAPTVVGVVADSFIGRAMGWSFIHNTSGATQRYYIGIGRITTSNIGGTSAFFDKTLTLLPTGRVAHIYATSTNFVD